MMTSKSWDEWVKTIADEYEVNLDPAQRQTQKQKQILEAAIHVFAEKGYSGASTHEIAERAGVAEATIFKHYRTKKGLLLRLVVPAIAKVAAPYIARPVLHLLEQDKPLHEVMQDVIVDRIQLVENNWKLIKIILVESLFHPELREALQNHVAKNLMAMTGEKLDRLKERGKLRNDLPNYVLLRSAMSMVIGYLLARNVFPEVFARSEEEAEIRMIADVFVRGAGGPKAREEMEGGGE
jgi:AcrR family transcriptional regulator